MDETAPPPGLAPGSGPAAGTAAGGAAGACPGAAPDRGRSPVEAALALVGADGAAWAAALGAGVPRCGDPWLEPVAGMAAPPELAEAPRGPR